mmetsp:Transcript_56100/g.170844  ORF Transcript_56100/g.170844 Transcript_56100/m.170844 type:complete len:270 (-) Transcript_56100:371-1180(-)
MPMRMFLLVAILAPQKAQGLVGERGAQVDKNCFRDADQRGDAAQAAEAAVCACETEGLHGLPARAEKEPFREVGQGGRAAGAAKPATPASDAGGVWRLRAQSLKLLRPHPMRLPVLLRLRVRALRRAALPPLALHVVRRLASGRRILIICGPCLRPVTAAALPEACEHEPGRDADADDEDKHRPVAPGSRLHHQEPGGAADHPEERHHGEAHAQQNWNLIPWGRLGNQGPRCRAPREPGAGDAREDLRNSPKRQAQCCRTGDQQRAARQ